MFSLERHLQHWCIAAPLHLFFAGLRSQDHRNTDHKHRYDLYRQALQYRTRRRRGWRRAWITPGCQPPRQCHGSISTLPFPRLPLPPLCIQTVCRSMAIHAMTPWHTTDLV
ncbi:hypothetical protein BV20DRAFT_218685 [Pilatotrama ljubarskyi]|nr:hypothetical protein BV20DRAFT_218685 [Pilatotrama ljubarskyi]